MIPRPLSSIGFPRQWQSLRAVAARVLVAALTLMVSLAQAQDSLLPPALAEGATLLDTSTEVRADLLIPLGSVKEGRDGRATPERSERVMGEVSQHLYQLSSGLTLKQSQALLLEQLRKDNGWLPLYQCEGRDCGQSNLWANDVFGKSLLFGNDRTQFAAVFVSADYRRLTMLYASERPNRRSHYLMQTIALEKPWTRMTAPPTGQSPEHWRLPVVFTGKGALDLNRLKQTLNPILVPLRQSTSPHWAVVAHDCSGGAAPQAFVSSQQILDAVLPLLQSLSKTEKTFFPVNAGSAFASVCDSGKTLEIIELPH